MAELWLRLAGAKLRSELQYRTSFALVLVMVFVFSFLDFVAVAVIFRNVPALEGWTYVEVAFLYGTSGVAFNLANVLVAGVDRAAGHIRAGTFDALLVRPAGTVLQLSAADLEPRRIGRLVQAGIVLAVALAGLDVTWTPARVAVVPLLVLAGFAIFGGIWVMAAAIGFWTVDNRALANSVTYAGNYLTFYPFDLFPAWLRAVTAVVPMAFVNYLPAAWLLGKDPAYDWPRWAGLLSPAVALGVIVLSGAVWRTALRHYRGTGT